MQDPKKTSPTVGIVTLGIASYLNPLLQLASLLQRQGYQVLFLSTNDVAASAAANNGYGFYRLDAIPGDACVAEAGPGAGDRWLPAGMRDSRRRARADQAWMEKGHGLPEFLQQHRPTLMFVMAEMHEYIVFLAGHKVPLVVVDTHLTTRRRPGIPPPHRGYAPASGLIARSHCALDWWLLKQRRRFSRFRQALRLGGAARFSALEQLAARLQLEPRQFLDLAQWHYVDYPRLPLLRLANPELDFPGNSEPGVFYAGALANNTTAPASTDSGDWRDFAKSAARAGRPLVYCSLGSFMSNRRFLDRVVKASTDQPWYLLVATGPDCLPAQLGELPATVQAYQWLPQWEVLAQAGAMLCAGGNATINECIFRGVPMLLYPIDRMDQLGMAARVEFHGLGLRGKQGDTPAQIAEKLASVLADDSIRTRIAAMQDQFRAYARSGRTEAAISQAMQSALHRQA